MELASRVAARARALADRSAARARVLPAGRRALPGLGHATYGAQRWIGAGPLQFEPSELMKLALVLYSAQVLARGRTANPQPAPRAQAGASSSAPPPACLSSPSRTSARRS
jgi:hypothetical protein